MVEIKIRKNEAERRVTLEIRGHAAPEGTSAVCAAVSSQIYGYAAVISTEPRHRLKAAHVDVKNGTGTVETVSEDAKGYRKILAYLAPVEAAFSKLAEGYPEAVSLTVT